MSSGVVEAGCKGVIGTRPKRAGMHWTVQGGNPILALRCCKLSGRFEDFWEHAVSAEENRVTPTTFFSCTPEPVSCS
ncbi:hypothetical protein SBA2_750018 [Acidobacteriia bacterium SbA2]|nr:hypothetical protein SBA2_750018 [Acidobacteriia bacterium SbA2]